MSEFQLHTPYSAAKVVNQWLADAGVDKVLPPQMFYNYTIARVRKGKAPFIKTDVNGKISSEDLKVWFDKYLAKVQRLAAAPTK
jgi:hypothetical protein